MTLYMYIFYKCNPSLSIRFDEIIFIKIAIKVMLLQLSKVRQIVINKSIRFQSACFLDTKGGQKVLRMKVKGRYKSEGGYTSSSYYLLSSIYSLLTLIITYLDNDYIYFQKFDLIYKKYTHIFFPSSK